MQVFHKQSTRTWCCSFVFLSSNVKPPSVFRDSCYWHLRINIASRDKRSRLVPFYWPGLLFPQEHNIKLWLWFYRFPLKLYNFGSNCLCVQNDPSHLIGKHLYLLELSLFINLNEGGEWRYAWTVAEIVNDKFGPSRSIVIPDTHLECLGHRPTCGNVRDWNSVWGVN